MILPFFSPRTKRGSSTHLFALQKRYPNHSLTEGPTDDDKDGQTNLIEYYSRTIIRDLNASGASSITQFLEDLTTWKIISVFINSVPQLDGTAIITTQAPE